MLAMGRFMLGILVVAGLGLLLSNGVSTSWLDVRGVGTRVEGREVFRDASQIEARFSVTGSLDDTFMLFGGGIEKHRNSLTHATVAGLAIRHARLIAERYPNFHLCKSPGAPQAQRLTETLSFVAADRAARDTLGEALDLYEERLRGDGERTCIRVTGTPLSLESVRLKQNGEDITREVAPAFAENRLVLAKRVQIEDCRALLR